MQEKYLPLISVIMPAYNAQQYIRQAIRSVQDQTYTNWELLVIDDGSSDDTCRIVQDVEMLKSGRKAAGVREVCVDYRVHSQGRASNKLASAKRRWVIYRSALELSVPASVYYMGCYMMNGLRKYRRREYER